MRWLLLTCALAVSSPAWANPAHVQNTGWTNSTTSATTVTLTGATAGNNIIVVASFVTSANRTYTVDDDQTTGCYSQAAENRTASSGFVTAIWYCLNIPGGTTAITITQSSTYNAYAVIALEVSTAGGTTLALDDTSVYDSASATTSYCADTTGFDPAAKSIVFCSVRWISGTAGGETVCGSYTPITLSTSITLSYLVTASALPSERPCYTTTNARVSENVAASFKEVGSASSGAPRMLLLGVGGE